MTTMAPFTMTDPLEAFTAGAFAAGTRRPVPLISTRFDVHITGGLAVVETVRRFRNDETVGIEATVTFPVPLHAALFALEARVDGRTVRARARRREQARATYEDAIERGKTAVLHEEVLRGVHMLSVAHLPPGAEIEVSTRWAAVMSIVAGTGQLRIPLTVGDIYGRSRLPDSDDLAHGGVRQDAELTVRTEDGVIALNGNRLEGGHARVRLDAPLDFTVTGWRPRDLFGRSPNGRTVTMRIEPETPGERALDMALVIDHSGSMGTACSAEVPGTTAHAAVVAGVREIAALLSAGDAVDLWEFDHDLAHVGSTDAPSRLPFVDAGMVHRRRAEFAALADRLSPPSGGTEIGAALAGVLGRSTAEDILLVTDGKSHALDIQALARVGRRIAVVLVGEDSLEANVGHLAALTGGDVFVAAGADLRTAMSTAAESLRRSRAELRLSVFEDDQAPRSVMASRSNARITAEWLPTPTGMEEDAETSQAVAAVAATIALPGLDVDAAAVFAETEGLTTHLTSLVLVDEAGVIQEGLPETRKIALPTPRTAAWSACRDFVDGAAFQASGRIEACFEMRLAHPFHEDLAEWRQSPAALATPMDLAWIGARIDWSAAPNRLVAGDLSVVEPVVAAMIERAAVLSEIVELARRVGLAPVRLVIALAALEQATTDRAADRVARAIIGARQISSPFRLPGDHRPKNPSGHSL